MGSKLISRGVAVIDVERAAHRIDELLAMPAKAFDPKTRGTWHLRQGGQVSGEGES